MSPPRARRWRSLLVALATTIVCGTTLKVVDENVHVPDMAAVQGMASSAQLAGAVALSSSTEQPDGQYVDCSASPDFLTRYFQHGRMMLRQDWSCGAALLKGSQRKTIACIGDSTTHGLNASRGEEYPAVLHRLFSKQFNVLNLGVTSSTARYAGNFSYWNSPQWNMAAKARIDIAIVMLGINDAAGKNWEKAEYVRDYLKMVQEILRQHPNATIFVAVPPPCKPCRRTTRHELADAVAAVWREAHLETAPINFYDAYAADRGRSGTNSSSGSTAAAALYLEDGVHPAAHGYELMAKVAHAAISRDMMSPRDFCGRCQASAHPDLCEKFCSTAPGTPSAATRPQPAPGRGHGHRHRRAHAAATTAAAATATTAGEAAVA